MRNWTAVVLAMPESESGPMVSRLPSFLHPVAGRPLIWHTVQSLGLAGGAPDEVLVLGPAEISTEMLDGTGVAVRTHTAAAPDEMNLGALRLDAEHLVLVHASAVLGRGSVRRIVDAPAGTWVQGSDGIAAAIAVDPALLERTIRQNEPFALSSGLIDPMAGLPGDSGTFLVRTRAALARLSERVRDAHIRSLMDGGVSFILPDSVAVDVDVRIGRDSVIYPGVVIEGQTTIGEETVIGPGCRIIDSWVGSGVELKGWNYIAHTSVRNRAILEPYVRRGFN